MILNENFQQHKNGFADRLHAAEPCKVDPKEFDIIDFH
jgi:hypothetical protein